MGRISDLYFVRVLATTAFSACLCFSGSPVKAQVDEIEDATCNECHDGYVSNLSGGPHQLRSILGARGTVVSCTSCHSGGITHLQDPSVANISNPGRTDASTTNLTCTKCHVGHVEPDGVGTDPHMMAAHTCTSCHGIHSAEPTRVASQKCSKCHPAVVAQFERQSNHPLTEGAIHCLDCHSLTGVNEPGIGHGASANCYSCHPEQGGPFRYEHPAGNSFSPNGSGCTACHLPHGSPNDRLLNQPGSGLCIQCHGTPPGHRTAHFSGLGIQYPCVECHSTIHGSDDNSRLLDPALDKKIPGGNCFNIGCHLLITW